MHFAVQQTDDASAITTAESINAPQPPATISGMSDGEIASVVNWNLLLAAEKLAPLQRLAGESITYNITYHAYANLTNLTILDDLPPQVSYLSDTCSGVVNNTTLTMNIGNLTSGAEGYCKINATVNNVPQGTLINNTALITYTYNTTVINFTVANQTLIPNPEVRLSKDAPYTPPSTTPFTPPTLALQQRETSPSQTPSLQESHTSQMMQVEAMPLEL